ASRIQRRKHNLARIARRQDLSAFWIDDLDYSKIGKQMIAGRRFVVRERTFRPGELGFRKSVDRDHVGLRSQLGCQVAQLVPETIADLFPSENDPAQAFATQT